ncbi:MAG: hypothetical protein M1828_004996 [Chrysothrix sp. TS-e1954]|nr:MAG: hypothetical protein M1828_004996 [Chrysothrix sp. TS-e1954]
MDSVKLRTPQDFESSAPSPAGRTVYAKMACKQCRKRKIRCQTDEQDLNDPFPIRKACKQCAGLGKKCTWPAEDGRKRPRMTSDGMIPAVTGSPAVWAEERSRSDSGLSSFPSQFMVNQATSYPVNAPPVYPAPGKQDYAQPLIFDPQYAPAYHHNEDLRHKVSSLSKSSTFGSNSSTVASGRQRTSSLAGERAPLTTIQYYRHHGPTALVPGYKKVSLNLNQECGTTHQDSSTMCHWPSQNDTPWGRSQASALLPIFDEATDLPARALLPNLLESFFQYYGDIFCFINRGLLQKSIDNGEVSSFLIWTMCALASRFTSPSVFAPYFSSKPGGGERERWEYAIPFLEKSKALVPPAISTPSTDAIAGFLFLGWADFGDNDEAGLFQYTGQALRMAQELGLHKERLTDDPNVPLYPEGLLGSARLPNWNPADRIPNDVFDECTEIVLFWCVLISEICLASGTGRVPGIKEYEISVRMPNDTDMAILRAGPRRMMGPVKHEIYPHLVRMMQVYARSTEFLNTDSRQLQRRRPSQPTLYGEQAESIKRQLIQEYSQLPKDIRYGAICYRSAVKSGQAAPYLVLHLFYHMHMAFLTQESLTVSEERSPKASAEPETYTHSHDPEVELRKTNEEIYRKAIKSIRDMVTLAKLIDGRPLISFFYLNQPFYHTACAYTRDMTRYKNTPKFEVAFPIPNEVSPSMVFPVTPPASSLTDHGRLETKIPMHAPTSDAQAAESTYAHLQLIAKANYQFARQSVKDQTRFYAGASWVDAALSQRESGLRDVDLSGISEKIATFIRLHGLSGGHLPKKVLRAKTEQLVQDDLSTWANLSSGMLSDEQLNFDPQAFFDDYMYNEQLNYGVGVM